MLQKGSTVVERNGGTLQDPVWHGGLLLRRGRLLVALGVEASDPHAELGQILDEDQLRLLPDAPSDHSLLWRSIPVAIDAAWQHQRGSHLFLVDVSEWPHLDLLQATAHAQLVPPALTITYHILCAERCWLVGGGEHHMRPRDSLEVPFVGVELHHIDILDVVLFDEIRFSGAPQLILSCAPRGRPR